MTTANVNKLLEELGDPSEVIADSKLRGLSNLSSNDERAFIDTWHQMDARRRSWLVRGLIDLAEEDADLNFDAVFFAALSDMEASIRRDAIRGLWEYESRDLIDSLVMLLERDPDAAVRAEAALAFGRFILQAEFETLRASDVERIEGALRRAISNTAEVSEVRARALEAAGARSEPWVRSLVEEAYESTDRVLRLSAVHAMGRSCDAAWLPTLVREMRSDEPSMRYEAAAAAGSIADETAVSYLLPLLDDEDTEVQEAAISALGQIGGSEAKRALAELVDTDDERLREAAEMALAEIDFAQDPLAFELRDGRG